MTILFLKAGPAGRENLSKLFVFGGEWDPGAEWGVLGPRTRPQVFLWTLALESLAGGPELHPPRKGRVSSVTRAPSSPAPPVLTPGQAVHPGPGPGAPQWRPRAGHNAGRPGVGTSSGSRKHEFCDSEVKKAALHGHPVCTFCVLSFGGGCLLNHFKERCRHV